MDLEKLTDRARGFLQAAQTIAVREHHQRIAPPHLLKALLDDEQGMAAGLIEAAGGDPKVGITAVPKPASTIEIWVARKLTEVALSVAMPSRCNTSAHSPPS